MSRKILSAVPTVRRYGALLAEFDGRGDNARKQTVGAHSLFSQRDAAAEFDGRGRPELNTVVAHGNLSQREVAGR